MALDTNTLMLMMAMGGGRGGSDMLPLMLMMGEGGSGFGDIDQKRLIAQMMTYGDAKGVIKAQNYLATNNPIYMMF